MLPITTLRKLAKDHFPPNNVEKILNIPKSKHQACFNDLRDCLKKLPNVDAWVRKPEETGVCKLGIYICGPSTGKNPNDYLRLVFETIEGVKGLWLHDAKRRRKTATTMSPVAISDVSEVLSFVTLIQERQQRDHLRDEKKQKVAGLQQTGLTARLKELGKEHNFAFAIGQTKRDVNLSIKLGGRKKGFHLAFPKSKLASVLEQVPDMIVMLEKLQGLSVGFWTHNKNWKSRQCDWIEPSKK